MTQYLEGVAAAMADYPNNRAQHNPYPDGSVEHYEWANGYSDGWNQAYMNHRWNGSVKK